MKNYLTNLFTLFLLFNFIVGQDENKIITNKEESKLIEVKERQTLARTLINGNKLNQAEATIQKAIELLPENERSYHILADIQLRQEKFDLALLAAAKAYKKSKHRQLLYLLEVCTEISPASPKIREQSMLWLKEAKQLKPKEERREDIIYSQIYLKNNDFENSIKLLEPYLDENSSEKNRLYILLANIYTKKGDYTKALELLQKGITREPILANSQNHLAYQLITYDDEKDNKPIVALKFALLASNSTNQNIEDVEDTLALAYFKTNDFENAVLAQTRAIKNLEKSMVQRQLQWSTKLQDFKEKLSFYEKTLKDKDKIK